LAANAACEILNLDYSTLPTLTTAAFYDGLDFFSGVNIFNTLVIVFCLGDANLDPFIFFNRDSQKLT